MGLCQEAYANFGKNAASKLENGDDVRSYFTWVGCLGLAAMRDAKESLADPIDLNVYGAVVENMLTGFGVIPDRKPHTKKTNQLNEKMARDGDGDGDGGAAYVEQFTLSAL